MSKELSISSGRLLFEMHQSGLKTTNEETNNLIIMNTGVNEKNPDDSFPNLEQSYEVGLSIEVTNFTNILKAEEKLLKLIVVNKEGDDVNEKDFKDKSDEETDDNETNEEEPLIDSQKIDNNFSFILEKKDNSSDLDKAKEDLKKAINDFYTSFKEVKPNATEYLKRYLEPFLGKEKVDSLDEKSFIEFIPSFVDGKIQHNENTILNDSKTVGELQKFLKFKGMTDDKYQIPNLKSYYYGIKTSIFFSAKAEKE